MVFDPKLFKYTWAKTIVPICVVLGLGYIDYAIFYSLGYQEVYKYHSHDVSITMWVLLAWCEICIFAYWIMLLKIGPGRAPQVKPFNLYNVEDINELAPTPSYFLCDEQGYPFWCNNCQSIKVPRTFHLKDMNSCVLKFDHYCIWVGTVIGQQNYTFFLNFVIWFDMFFIIALIFLSCYTRLNINRGTKDIDHNYIVLYILCGFWILVILSLLFVHLWYVAHNMTTLDDVSRNQLKKYLRWKRRNDKKKKPITQHMPRKEDGKRYINIEYNDSRAVVQYTLRDTPFSHGIKKNWINIWVHRNNYKDNSTLHEDSYSKYQLFKSILLFVVPFYSISDTLLKRKRTEDSEEIGSEDFYSRRLREYEQCNPKLNDLFLANINEKLMNNQYHIPAYIPSSIADGMHSTDEDKQDQA